MTAQVKGFGSRPIAAVGAHAEGPASVPRVRGVHRRLARHRDSGGFAPFPAPSGADRRAAAKHQQRGRSLAFLLYRDARPADLARRLTVVREPRRLPAVLSVEEVTLLLQAAPGPKYKAAFATAYGAGLRVSEVVALKVGDVDSERM